MKEALLQFIWQQGLFEHSNLSTAAGETVTIIRQGDINSDAGPDFSDARIKIGDTLWAGNVELHVKSSEWKEHAHHLDSAYNNVILHVVYSNDLTEEKDTINLPVLELNDKIDHSLIDKYEELMKSRLWIPCQDNLSPVREITKSLLLERMVIERLEYRYNKIIATVIKNKYDWHESFHQLLARSFGFNTNSETFEKLACFMPLRLLARHRTNILQIESLLYGQAGMLNRDFEDTYPSALKKEYDFLRKKYSLVPMNDLEWKFARLRPANFPTIRLSQYAQLVNKSENLFSKIMDTRSLEEISDLLEVTASDFWISHYTFEKPSTDCYPKSLGKESINNVIINTIIPFIFTYGREKQRRSYIDKAIKFLGLAEAEKNKITRNFESLTFSNKNASDSQGLIHLKKVYCDLKKCLRCPVGNEILKTSL